MKIKLHGQEIRDIRNAFGLETDAFASVLAVHPGTVRRWELSSEPVSVDGIAAGVLTVARERLHRTPPPSPHELQEAGRQILATLAAAGALLALVWLITWLTAKH